MGRVVRGVCCGTILTPLVDYGFRTFAVIASSSSFESEITDAEQALEYFFAVGEQDDDGESSSGDNGLDDSSEELELEVSSCVSSRRLWPLRCWRQFE